METAMGGIVVVIVLAFGSSSSSPNRCRGTAAERLSGRAARQIQRHSGARFHILIPFLDVIRYKHSLKEQAVDFRRKLHHPG